MSTRQYIYASDITATRTGDHITVEPMGVDLDYTINHGCDFADFPQLTNFFRREDLSLSQTERDDLQDYFDAVARGLDEEDAE